MHVNIYQFFAYRQFPFKSYDLIVIKYTTEMNYAFLLFLEIGECHGDSQEWFHTEKQHFLNKLIFFITLYFLNTSGDRLSLIVHTLQNMYF